MAIEKIRQRWTRAAAPLLVTGVLAAGFAGVAGAQSSGGGAPGGASPFAKLTDAQRSCLADQGLQRPSGRPTPEFWRSAKAAAEKCGIELSRPSWTGASKTRGQERAKARFQKLTAAQKACLVEKGLTRPAGRPTLEQVQKLRAAAADCGIAIGGSSAARPA